MIVEKLALQSFMGYTKRVELDFRGKRTISITGSNESGKSSILQAISYGLYGKTRADSELSLINSFSDTPLVVDIKVRLDNGKLLEITRGRTRKNEAILKVAGHGGRSRELNSHIIDQLGLVHEDFVALSYFVQGDIHQFMTQDKRAYFQRWTTGLGYWKTLEDEASGRLQDANRVLMKARNAVAAAVAAMGDEDEIIKRELRTRKLSEEAQERETIRSQQVSTLLAKTQKEQDREEICDAVDDLKSHVEDLTEEIFSIGTIIKRLESELKQIGSSQCPILNKKCELLWQDKGKQKCSKLSGQLDRYKEKKSAKEDKLSACNEKLSSLQAKLKKKSDPRLKEKLRGARQEYGLAQSEMRRAINEHAVARVALENLESAKKVIDKLRSEEDDAIATTRQWQFIKYMCGRSGIPSMLIQGELDHVENRCNWVLERLGYPKRIKFSAYRELQSYEQVCPKCGGDEWRRGLCRGCGADRPRKRRDEPTITVLDGTTERPFALESGGAQVLQSFAARMAGSLFRASMTGVPVRMIMLDEVFSFLDSTNRQNLMSLVLDKLATEFGLEQQFVVTHHEDVVSAVQNSLHVSKRNGTTTVEWL